jgi:methylglutaconyl-CoA hydratase
VDYQSLQVTHQDGVALLVLNRPAVHNAFDDRLVAELATALRAVDANPAVRAVVLLGAGKSFCAGADLQWMRAMAEYSAEQNRADALALAQMLRTLAELGKPTVARVHGSVFGGGVGLVAACDIAIATQDAVFSTSESRLGLIPATISPYVVDAIGARAARRLFLTGERFTAAEAYRLGLVHDLALPEALDDAVDSVLGELLNSGPAAQAACKRLIREVAHRPVDDALVGMTADRIAEMRASPEGREGVSAFLERRRPAWAQGN